MTTASIPATAEGASRVPATPYARRLARERGIPLALVAGSGPNGRRTGLDVLRHAPAPAPAAMPAAAPAAPAVSPGLAAPAAAGLAASVSLAAIAGLLPQFGSVEPAIALVDVCLKAASASLRTAPPLSGAAIVLTGRPGIMDGLDRLTLGAIAAMRHEAGDATLPGARPVVEVSWLARDGIRPIALPLRPGTAARILVAGTTGAVEAECLLSYDPTRLDDTAAADFLLAFKGWLEVPLRMIA